VRLGVGRVAVLVEEDPLGVLVGEHARHAHRAVGPLAAGRLDDLGSPELEELAPLGRDVGRHDRLQVVALDPAHHGEADTGVARGRLHQHLVGLAGDEHAGALGVFHQ
jgi:hypothetical protein